jgi:hypothetical protein
MSMSLFYERQGACRNTGTIEAVGKCADVTENWPKAHGTGLKEKQVPKVM